MMRRTIVSVATGDHYGKAQDRLRRALNGIDPDSQLLFWKDLPAEWPTHDAKPYAFKAYALSEAWRAGADLVLWCDSIMFPVRSLEPLWEKIEREGYWLALNGWTNYEWTADSAYKDLFPGNSIDYARVINKGFPQMVGTAFGLNLRSDIGKKFFDEYYRLASETDCFCGPWSNTNNPKAHPQGPSRMGPCGPGDVLGHRHDQTAASVIAWRLGMKLTECPEIFSYPPPQESTILVADGGMTFDV